MINLRSLAAAALVLSSSSALATPRMAVVDIQKIIDGSQTGKNAKDSLQTEMQSKQQKLFQLGKEVEQMRGELSKQAALLSKDALEKRQDLLTQKEREAKRGIEEQRQELKEARDRAIGKLVSEIDVAVKQIATKELYDLVVERDDGLVLYAAEDMDISPKVIKLLDSKR
jgi:outer membrane protein